MPNRSIGRYLTFGLIGLLTAAYYADYNQRRHQAACTTDGSRAAKENKRVSLSTTEQQDADDKHHQKAERRFWKISICANVLTIAVAVAAVLLAAFTFEDAHEFLTAVQRAFVFHNPIGSMQPVIVGKDPARQWSLGPEWENSGNTQTVNMQVYLSCTASYFNEVDPFNAKDTQFSQPSTRVLGPKQKEFGGFCKIGKDAIDQINSHSFHFYVMSIVIYQDIFGEKHITESCSEITEVVGDPMSTPPTALSLNAGACERRNCADAQCGQDKFGDHRAQPNWIRQAMQFFGIR